MFTGLTKSKSSFAHGRAGRQNLARRVDRRSYASSCVSSRRVCNESLPLSLAATTKVVRRFHRNQQYSIVALTNGGGSITERYAYDAYGTPTITDAAGTTLTTSVDNNRYTYTGREYDEALGLYHYRARMYDSVAGRFCSKDPIGYDGSPWNLYEFMGGRPYIGTDPSGTSVTIVSNLVPCVASDHARCNAACVGRGKPGGRARACLLVIRSVTTPCGTGVWRSQYQSCKCFNKRSKCFFYYQWCKWGASMPNSDPGKPFWPNNLSQCDACYANCQKTGKWNCVAGGGRRGPKFPKPNEPWGPAMPTPGVY
jgi:RHS repeat-associated protein